PCHKRRMLSLLDSRRLCESLSAKITHQHHIRIDFDRSGIAPLVNSRQGFAGKLRVSHRFVPADAGYRKIRGTFRWITKTPSRGAWTACEIVEFRHRLVPRDGVASLEKWFFPILLLSIAAGIDEPLELTVCDFILVHPESRQRNRWLNQSA